jgi:hypothetical protein
VNRRTYIRVLLWLLPLVVARAFIPSGFMLGAGADGFGLIFCSGTMPVAPQSQHQHPGHVVNEHAGHVDHSEHAGHNHYEADNAAPVDSSADHAGHHSHGEDSTACPYAIGACAASIDVPHLASISTPPVDEQVQLEAVPTRGIEAPRSHPIRGPPQI